MLSHSNVTHQHLIYLNAARRLYVRNAGCGLALSLLVSARDMALGDRREPRRVEQRSSLYTVFEHLKKCLGFYG